jgi:hypothetical protein
MSLDDVLIAMTLGGLFLSAIYIRAGFTESRRQRDLETRSEDVDNLHRTGDKQNASRAIDMEESQCCVAAPISLSYQGPPESS